MAVEKPRGGLVLVGEDGEQQVRRANDVVAEVARLRGSQSQDRRGARIDGVAGLARAAPPLIERHPRRRLGAADRINAEFLRWIWSFCHTARPRVLELLDQSPCEVVFWAATGRPAASCTRSRLHADPRGRCRRREISCRPIPCGLICPHSELTV
ncbi:MAG: hypothetical protein AVDCRST_MAG53-3474 [uncultured Solirubrobacteraceae bacterium]|uniref:Uncharacterized protein n=1 Tax=uncultured Solirubrobacteraceae bacterium TaxID=1162706 RepID=A0A6J4THP1_9ACTN|nr:MAG: hypothetical protein AVDCRST_MAG53-3474 [uncultured Solirubrobacteraceae bacterium]